MTPYNPSVPLLEILPKISENIFKQRLIQMFMAAFFINSQKLKKCPSAGEQIKQIVVHSWEGLFLSNKKSEMLMSPGMWMNLRSMLSEREQSQIRKVTESTVHRQLPEGGAKREARGRD